MFYFYFYDTFQSGLGHSRDLAASHMFAQQHTEIRGGERTHFIFFRKIDQGQGCAG